MEKFSPALLAALHSIQSEFGKEVLTKGHTKLAAISRVVSKEAVKSEITAGDLLAYVVEGLHFRLRYELMKPGDVTLDKLSTGTTVGYIDLLLAVRAVVASVLDLVENIPAGGSSAVLRSECDELLVSFSSFAAAEKVPAGHGRPYPSRPAGWR